MMLTADMIPHDVYRAAVNRVEIHDDPCAEYEIGDELYPATYIIAVYEGEQQAERHRIGHELVDKATPAIAQTLRDHFDATSETSDSIVGSRRYITVELGEFAVFVQVDVIHKDDPLGL